MQVHSPSDQFTLFPKLPAELQLKVWNLITNQPRLIEMENIKGGGRRTNSIQVTIQSRGPPTVLSVCHESRIESLKAYTKVSFNKYEKPEQNQSIYYNPEVDIVYFGTLGSIRTMVYLFENRLRIPRVAILMNYKSESCDHSNHGVVSSLLHLGGTFGHCVQTLRILHGFDPVFTKGSVRTWPGCDGLIDAFWVIRSPTRSQLGKRASWPPFV